MINIKLITVGKIKEKYLTLGMAEYSKRLTKYCKMDTVQINDEKIPEKASKKQEEGLKHKEGQKILPHIKNHSYVIALCIEGRSLDSMQLAETIEQLAVKGKSHITFIIGGSLGLSDEVKDRADLKLSFSKLTFPHQLMGVMLLEQIYRSFKILNNEIYHK